MWYAHDLLTLLLGVFLWTPIMDDCITINMNVFSHKFPFHFHVNWPEYQKFIELY